MTILSSWTSQLADRYAALFRDRRRDSRRGRPTRRLGVELLEDRLAPATFTAAKTGDWSDAATWTITNADASTGTLPSAVDDVVIGGSFDVTLLQDSTAAAKSVRLAPQNNSPGTLTFLSGATLTVATTFTFGGLNNAALVNILDMSAGGTLVTQGLAILNNVNRQQLKPGTGTIHLTADNTLPGGNQFTTYNNLIVDAGTTTRFGQNTALNGTLTVHGTVDLINPGSTNSTFELTVGALAGVGTVTDTNVTPNANGNINNQPLTVNTTSPTEFAGRITGSLRLVVAGTSVLTLSNSLNDYAGRTEIGSGATLRLGAANAIPNQRVDVLAGGVLDLNGFDATIAALNLFSGDGVGSSVTTGAGTLRFGNLNLDVTGSGSTGATIAGNLHLRTAVRTFTIADGTALTILANIVGGAGGGITKAGLGTLLLQGANTYTGATTVNAGTLLVDGSLAAASAVSVAAGATLGGGVGATAGTVAGTVAAGGTVSPGASYGGTSTGILATSSLSFDAGSAFNVDINGTTAGAFDQLDVTGTVQIATGGTIPVLNVSVASGFTPGAGSTYTIIQTTDGRTGTFAGLEDGAVFQAATGESFKINYSASNVVLTRVGGANAAPAISDVTITPAAPFVGDTLTANVTASDPDGDTISFSYQWYKNGNPIAGATASTLVVADHAVQGDSITVEVTASDGSLSSSAFPSSAVIIGDNTAPTVTSIVRTTPTGPDTNATSVTFTVTFSEDVTGIDADDFAVAASGVAFAAPLVVAGSGSVYTVTVNGIAGTGTLGLNLVDNDSIVDSASNPLGGAGAGNGSFTGQVYNVDTIAPTVVSIVRTTPAGPTTNAASVTFTVTFSESVSGVDETDFDVAVGGSVAFTTVAVSGSGSVYTVTFSGITGAGTLGLNLDDDDTIVDGLGNVLNGNFTGEQYTIDRSAPTVSSIVRTTPVGPDTNATSVTFTVTFSEDVTGVDAADFDVPVSGMTFTAPLVIGGSGSVYTVTVNGIAGAGTLGLNFNDNDTVADLAGNPTAGGFNGPSYHVDNVAPVVNSIVRTTPAGPLTNAASVSFTVTFSSTVTGVTAADFQVATTGGVTFTSPVVVAGSDASYTVTVNGIAGTGTLGLNLVDDDSIQDLAGNSLAGGFTGEVYTVDQTAPTVQSIVRTTPAGPAANAASVTFTVTFSSDVVGVNAADFQVATSGSTTFTSPVVVSGSASSYTVTVNGISGAGTLGLNLVDDDSIADLASNALAGGFTGQVYTIDRIAPVASIDSFPPNPSTSPSAAFTFSATDVGSGVAELRYQLDGGSVVVVPGASGSASFPNVPAGAHTFTVTAVDQAGNLATATYTWFINVSVPTVGIYDAATATWYLRNSNNPGAPDVSRFAYGWGGVPTPTRSGSFALVGGSAPVVGDWDGDGDATIGVYDPNTATWYLRNSNTPGAPDFAPFAYGFPGAIPVVGDWDGNGTVTIGIYDPNTAIWYLRNSNSPGAPDLAPFAYGFPGAIPVVGDWDGDGDTNIGVYHPGTAQWFLRNVNGPGAPTVPVFAYGFGSNPVVGDWNGDGIDSVGIYHPGTAQWFLRDVNSGGVPTVPVFAYGFGSSPVVGDWNFPAALHATEAGPGAAALTADDLDAAAAGALELLGGADAAWLARLGNVRFEIANLGGNLLGLAFAKAGRILIDDDAAGHGWFLDPTPLDDVEFTGLASPAAGRIDLLSAVLHELGHIAGLDHDAAIMAESIAPGTRRR